LSEKQGMILWGIRILEVTGLVSTSPFFNFIPKTVLLVPIIK
jgi:hypothetical protein